MWIDKVEKRNYTCEEKDYKYALTGLRLFFHGKINNSLKENVIIFCKWIRKHYWFPIRLSIWLLEVENFRLPVDDNPMGSNSVASFYYQLTWDDKPNDKKILPKIYIATGKYKNYVKRHGFDKTLYNYLSGIAHEITHYYQWFFNEFDERSDRSLEIEANRWADYLVDEFNKTIHGPKS